MLTQPYDATPALGDSAAARPALAMKGAKHD